MTEPLCAGCGGSPVVYRNFAEQPLCAHCCECSCGTVPCSAPQPEQPVRHRADTITDDELDALYARIGTLEAVADSNKRAYKLLVADVRAVRTALDELCHEPHPQHDHVCPDDVRDRIRAALDEPKRPV